MKACINCAISDYSPYGNGLFGNMICFRGNKAGYLALPSGENFEKDAYFAVLRALPDLRDVAVLEPAVLVAGRRASIKIGAGGKTTFNPGELERLMREFRG